jgi:two-component sensor histidine kinase
MALAPWLSDTMVFPTYYPVALIGTLLFGWRGGLLIILTSALSADFFFMPPAYNFAIHARDIAGVLVFVITDGIIVLSGGLLRSALVRLQAAHEREALLNAELQHRLKNTLAVIHGLVSQTARSAPRDVGAFRTLLEGRLLALASAHDVLSTGRWESCELTEIVERALAPFAATGRIAVRGQQSVLRAECCVPLVLALHELATNAVKYGALSAETGAVELSWTIESGANAMARLCWRETGGPTVAKPSRRGLGSRLLTSQSGLDVALEFNPAGLICEIKAPLHKPSSSSSAPVFSLPGPGPHLASRVISGRAAQFLNVR